MREHPFRGKEFTAVTIKHTGKMKHSDTNTRKVRTYANAGRDGLGATVSVESIIVESGFRVLGKGSRTGSVGDPSHSCSCSFRLFFSFFSCGPSTLSSPSTRLFFFFSFFFFSDCSWTSVSSSTCSDCKSSSEACEVGVLPLARCRCCPTRACWAAGIAPGGGRAGICCRGMHVFPAT